MIGQKNLQAQIGYLIENNTFPRFSIIVGPSGSGKKTLAQKISCDLKALFYCCDIKVDAIRSMITDCYKLWEKTCYVIPDADNMSNAAKNALLKVTEEPPNNAYFIMTLEDENNTLETIKSRATVFHMDRYTPNEILEYSIPIFGMERLDNSTRQIITDLCETPGDVNTLNKYSISEFYDYVQLVADNIADVSLANAFKIPSKVALKDTDDGYDLRLFWKAFMKICSNKMFCTDKYDISRDVETFGNALIVTSKYLQKLRIKGINKQMLIDNWLIEIREALNE